MPSTAMVRPLKVTFCVYDKPDNVGGPVTWIQRLVPELSARGYDVRCLFLLHWGDTGPALSHLRESGIRCEWTVAHERTVDRVRWILERLAEDPPDVFVPNLVVAGYFACRWLRKAGMATIGVLHSDDRYYRGIQEEFVFGDASYQVSAVVSVSRELERQLNSRTTSAKIVRIPYGVPVAERKDISGSGQFRIAYVGRLAEEQKRISDVARVMVRIADELPMTSCEIIGDGPDRDAVEQVVAHSGTSSVRILGALPASAVQRRLHDHHAIILLSDYEGLPIALLEAMACGCVPVCLDIKSGIPEIVENGTTGLIVENRGDAVVDAIRRLQTDRQLWEQLSIAAHTLVSSEFGMTICAERWAALLEHFGPRKHSAPIAVPSRIRLPKFNPALEDGSYRRSSPGAIEVQLRRLRMSLGSWRRRLWTG